MATAFKPPATQRLYDVCILGGGLGGAAAGALLARRGFRVLLVDEGGHGARVDGGWLLPQAPTLEPSVRALPAADALLSEVGLSSDAARAQEPLAPGLQLLLPRHRLELARDPAALAGELRREWPGEAARLGAALQALGGQSEAVGHFLRAAPPLPPGGFLEGFALRKARRAAEAAAGPSGDGFATRDPLAAVAGHPVATALLAIPGLLGHLDGPPSAAGVARLAGTALRGLHRTGPAAHPLEEALRKKIAETRGELLGGPGEPARVESIAVEGGRLGAVRVAGHTDSYAARAYLLSGPLSWLRPLLGQESPKVTRSLARLRPGRRLASLHQVIHPAGLPPGLGGAAILLPADDAPAAEAVLLEVQPARRAHRVPGQADPERLVTAWTLAGAGEEGAAAATRRLEAALSGLLPWLPRHLVHRAGPVLSAHLVEVDDPAVGVAGLPVRSPWKNLLLAGREVVPGLGLEGELYAGLQAAAQAQALLGVKDRPR